MRKAILWIVLSAAVLGPAAGAVLWWRGHHLGQVRTHNVDAGDILSGVTVSGTVRSRFREAVAAEVLAAVRAIHVREGQRVTKGQELLALDDGVVAAEEAKARASAKLAAHRLADLKAGPRAEETERAEKEVSRAEAQLAYAKKQHESIVEAAKRGVATQSELDLAVNRLNRAQAELGAAEAGLALLKAGTRKDQIAAAGAEVSLAEAEVQRLEALRRKYTLRATNAGVVTLKAVNVGEVVAPGQLLLRVDNVRDLEIRAQVQESQLPAVKIGGQARVLTDAHPDEPLAATVDRILPRVDPEQGTVTVLLTLAGEPSIALMDGMAADIALIGEEVTGAVRVPVEAVEGRGRAASVWVREGGSFARRPVVTGVTDGRWVQIKSGLRADDVVRLP